MAYSDLFAKTANIIVSQAIGTASVLIAPANSKRMGGILWNNSSHPVYIAFALVGDSDALVTLLIEAYSHFVIPPPPIYQGPISGKRSAGTGTVSFTEFVA